MKFKNYVNAHTGDNRIYSFEDIIQMPFGDVLRNKEELLSQNRVLGVPTVAELQSSQSVVYVNSYTREDGTVVKSHYRSKPDGIESNNFSVQKNSFGTLTGGASKIIQEIKEERDFPEMTKEAERQEWEARMCPPALAYELPEREYYKLAFVLKDARDGQEVPDWVKKHNELIKLKDVKNVSLRTFISDKVKKAAIADNDKKTLSNIDDVYTIVVKPNSKLTQIITKSPELKSMINVQLSDIKSKRYENNSISFTFENADLKDSESIKKIKYSTYHTVNNCDLYNLKLEQDGTVSFTIVDYYDFADSTIPLVKNAYIQQKNGRLETYILLIPIRVKI